MKKYLSLLLILSLALSLTACGGSTSGDSSTQQEPTHTEQQIDPTQGSTSEPEQITEDPVQEESELVIPDDVVYSGSGDDVLTIEPLDGPYVFYITGNSAGRHFAVKTYDEAGNYLDLLVNTSDPYEGVLVDVTQSTSMIEVNATGDWSITLTSLYNVPIASSGVTCNGSGDSVFLISGDVSIATITGNQAGSHFAVKAYGDYDSDLLVNTTAPYEGKVLVKCDPFLFIVSAVGDWSISFE